jgi:LysM repeat protein
MYFRELNKETYFDYYTIDKGDNLYKISRKYNINPNLLASLNGLDMNDYIYPGQTLLIPNSNYSYYITKQGDTLDMVSKTFNVSNSKLLDDNKTIYLLEGQMLVNKKN